MVQSVVLVGLCQITGRDPPSRSTSPRARSATTRRDREDARERQRASSHDDAEFHPQIPQRLWQVEANQRNAAHELVRLKQENANHAGLMHAADKILKENIAKITELGNSVVALQVQLAQHEAFLNQRAQQAQQAPQAPQAQTPPPAEQYVIGSPPWGTVFWR